MDESLFDFAAEKLEQYTGFSRLEARGTLRIALKDAGLDARTVNGGQLCVVFEKLMPLELGNRGVADAADVCSAVVEALVNAPAFADGDSSNDLDGIFRRLGGN